MKTVLITGASSGIGHAATIYFAEKGWKVAATSRKIEPETFKQWPNVHTYSLDVTLDDSVDKTFEQIISEFGVLDVVVNNAGYGLHEVFEALDMKEIQSQFEVNVFGLMRITRKALSIMRQQRHGTIVQISSMGGRITFPSYSIYHASKWAVEGFSEALQYEVRQLNIRIRLVEPGVIKTDFYDRPYEDGSKNIKGYEAFVNKISTVTSDAGKNGVEPRRVARTIYAAATNPSWRLRYVVGWPAPILLILRRIMPERFFFFLIRKGFKL